MIYDEVAMNNGVIFQYAYDILNEKMQQGFKGMVQASNGADGNASLDAALFVPVVVNSAFACELFMKSMLPNDTRGHKLNDLFDLLDNDIQERIREFTIDKMKKLKADYSDTDFQNDLVNNNNVFAEWRYFHEGNSNSVNLQFISQFMKAIFIVIEEDRKK